MKNFNESFLYESSGPGARGIKNRCSSPECKCSPRVVNVHHYQCPLMKIPCPIHGYPFVYNIKSKKTPPDQCLVISFHPSLKTDKLFEPVKTFLSQTCEPDTKISFQYNSPRFSETHCEEFKHRQVQTNPKDFKKLKNSCFVEKTKTFFSDKTNKMKKLKQCFNSPCSSVVHKSQSSTAVKGKIDRIFREVTCDGYPEKPKLEKRIQGACCMKSEQSSHFLYKRDFDLSDGEKSSKEKIDPGFLAMINNNFVDRNVFEITSRGGFNGRLSANTKSHFIYPSFVTQEPIMKVGHTQTEEVSDLDKINERSQNPNAHTDELTKDKDEKEEKTKASQDENTSSDSSSSVYFTPFIFVPGGRDKEVYHKEIQTVKIETDMSSQWVQTLEYYYERVSKEIQTESSELLVEKAHFTKPTETQTSGVFMPEACICSGPRKTFDEKGKEKPAKVDAEVQTPHQRRSTLLSDSGLRKSVETLAKDIGVKDKSVEAAKPVSLGTEAGEESVISTVVYYEPEMKFLRRKEKVTKDTGVKEKGMEAAKLVSLGTQTEEEPTISTVVYQEPEMKFLRRKEKLTEDIGVEEKSMEAAKLVSLGTQTEEKPVISTVVYQEPEMKFLRRKENLAEDSDVKDKSVEAAKPVNLETETEEESVISTVVYYEPEMKFLRRKEKLTKDTDVKEKSMEAAKLVSLGTQTEEEPIISTVVYYEPEMKFLRREETSENEKKDVETEKLEKRSNKKERSPKGKEKSVSNGKEITGTRSVATSTYDDNDEVEEPKSVGLRTENLSTTIYYEPEMKFLTRDKNSENAEPVEEQTQSNPEPVTVIYFEPEPKHLKRKGEGKKREVLFKEETQVKEIETRRIDKSVGTGPETLEDSEHESEKYDSAMSHKETKANSDSESSQSYYDGSDCSNATYIVKSYVSEESEQVVVKKWNKSLSDGDMLDKKKYEGLTKAEEDSSTRCQCVGTNPDDLTFVRFYHSKKKEYYTNAYPQDSRKTKHSKPEAVTKNNEENKASLADLSDLVQIIDENFKKMFDRTIEMCECQRTRERKPTADKEVMTNISWGNDIDVLLQMGPRSMANAQIQACLPALEEMPVTQYSNPYQEPPTSICEVCSKVISTTTVNIGTNTPNGSYIQTKIQEVDMGTYCEDFPIESIQEAYCSEPKSIGNPSTSEGKSGEIKSITMNTKTVVIKQEKAPESNKNRALTPSPRKTITYSEPFSDSTTSLQRDLRRAQQVWGVKPKPPRPTPSQRPKPVPTPRPTPRSTPRPTPGPTPRQTQLPQSKPQVVTHVIPDNYCGNIMATITTRVTPSPQVQEKCPFQVPSTSCDDVDNVCPVPPHPNPEQCPQRTQPSKKPDTKQNHMTYHVTVSPLWSKDVMKMFQEKFKKISESESTDSVNDWSGKQKRNHDGGSDGGPIGKKKKSSEQENITTFDPNPSECERIDCFEFGKSQTDITFKFLTERENEIFVEEDSPQLTKGSGFVWLPSFSASEFSNIRQVSSAKESKETPEKVRGRLSQTFSEIPKEKNLYTKNACHQNADCTDENHSIKKIIRCSSSKSLAYVQLKNSDIIEEPKTNTTNFKSDLEDSVRRVVLTPTSDSHVEITSLDNLPENSPLTEELISPISSGQVHVNAVPSTEANILPSDTDPTHKFFNELFSKILSEKSDQILKWIRIK